MKLNQLKENWKSLGKDDPFWAVLTDPSKINNQWEKEAFFRTGKREIKRLLNYFNVEHKIKLGRALDFGCGPGRLTQALASKFTEVIGVDISSTMIDQANQHNQFPEKCRYVVNEINQLDQFETSSFDLVFSYITLQHIEPQFTKIYLSEFVRAAKQGGHILFNIPSRPSPLYNLLYSTIGSTGLNFIRRIYYRKSSVIEMHWIEETEVIQFMKEEGADLLKKVQDTEVGKNWKSNIYLFRKL